MTMFELTLDGVTYRYSRRREAAVAQLTLSLGSGIVGLIGPNGAGKTTLLELLLGLRDPGAGEVRICGRAPAAFRRSEAIGFIPASPSFPAHLTVREFLEAIASLAGPGRASGEAAPEGGSSEAERRMWLDELSGFRLGELSLGQLRRVEVAAALLGNPPLLLLDEPTNGLDPLALAEFRRLILASRRPGRLILVSSHHLDELQRVADRLVVLDRGRLMGSWSAQEVRDRSGSFHDHFLDLVAADA